MARKNHPTLACFCVRVFLFIVLNEMSPLVSFLVGHVRNYFQKFVCMRTMSDQSMTFSETTKWGTIHLECGNSFTRSLSLEKHLAWTHGRLCHPPLLSLIWGQASSLVDLVWRVLRIASWTLKANLGKTISLEMLVCNRYLSMLHGFQTAGCARQQLLAESRGPCREPCRERGMTRWSRWTGLRTGWWTG